MLQSAYKFLHHNFLILLILSYVCSAFCPQAGLQLRQINFGNLYWFDGSHIKFTISVLMMSILLFNAGFGFKVEELKQISQKPLLVVVVCFVNLLAHLVVLLVIYGMLKLWHSNNELQCLILGLSIVASMPIAGASTAWSQNADGNIGLSLGLVMLSTFTSPITTPIILNCFKLFTDTKYDKYLTNLSEHGTNTFLILAIVLPSLIGILARIKFKKHNSNTQIKLINLIILLLLNYSNACLSLPEILVKPDWDFYALVLAVTFLICSLSYLFGFMIAKYFKCNKADTASIVFALGMNNNGTGLVLAGLMLSNLPRVMLPLIFYTLIQQVLAAIIDKYYFSKSKI